MSVDGSFITIIVECVSVTKKMHDGKKWLRLKRIVKVMQNESEQFKQYKKHKNSEMHNTMAFQL